MKSEIKQPSGTNDQMKAKKGEKPKKVFVTDGETKKIDIRTNGNEKKKNS